MLKLKLMLLLLLMPVVEQMAVDRASSPRLDTRMPYY
jgi:hypothetical protein